MEHLLQNANLSPTGIEFIVSALRECPSAFRVRELFWQLKILSRIPADRQYFESVLSKKKSELARLFPFLGISAVPPVNSTPLSCLMMQRQDRPSPFLILTQIFLEQILNSTDVLLDLGSRADAFFISERDGSLCWVPDAAGTRWHEPFRCELARLYLGWAFDQIRLVDAALQALHMSPLKESVLSLLAHWREPVRCAPQVIVRRFLSMFKAAEDIGLHLHPNALVWALYELEFAEISERSDFMPNLESSADGLCRMRAQIA